MNSVDKREMWSLLSDLRGGKKTTTKIDTAVLHDHFEKILFSPHKIPKDKLDIIEKKLGEFLTNPPTPTPDRNCTATSSSPITVTNHTNSMSSPTISQNTPPKATLTPNYDQDFILKMGKTLKNGKSAFTDGAINEIIKHSLPSLAPIFTKYFNIIETSGIFPTAWKTSFLVPLHKKRTDRHPRQL